MKSIRLSHIASHHLPVPPIRGGAIQLWIDEVAKRLAAKYDVQVVSPADSQLPLRESNGRLTYQRIRFGRAYVRIFQKILGMDPFPYGERIARTVQSFQPDIVHLYGGGSQWLPPLRKRLGDEIPLVIHLQNDPGDELHKWRFRDFSRSVIFVACSQYIKETGIKYLGIEPRNCYVIQNGVDVTGFTPWWERPDIRSEVRKRYGIPEDACVLLFCGRVAPEKGPQHLARAAAGPMGRIPDLWVVFVGDYKSRLDEGKPEWYDTYEAIRSSLEKVWERVVFAGFVPPSGMPRMFGLGDIFVGPAEWAEPFGMVYVEAMASGLPVIATRKGGIPEIISPSVGILVKDPDELASAIHKLVIEKELRRSLGREARRMAEQSFDWSVICKKMETFVEKILPRR